MRRRSRGACRFRGAVAASAFKIALDRTVLAAVNTDLLDPPRIGIQHLDLEALGPAHQLAAQRQTADLRHQIAADGIDLLGGIADVEFGSYHGTDVVEAGAGVSHERTVELPNN